MFLNKVRNHPQVMAMILAVCLALTAQYFFTGEIFTHQRDSNTWTWTSSFSLASLCLTLAIFFSTRAALSRGKSAASFEDYSYYPANGTPGRRNWLIAATACYVVSIILFLRDGENSLVRWLWLGGIILLIVALWPSGREKSSANQISSWEWILVGMITLAGFILRYYKLTEIPSHVDNDVALMGTFALDLIRSGQYNWIGYSESEHLLSYVQFLAWSMRLFGQNHYGIVMCSVVMGIFCLIFTFLLGRELGGRFTGFMAIGLLTISYTNIHFSRILFGNSSSLAIILTMYALFKGIRYNQHVWFALAGVAAGIGVLLYDSSRVIPVIIGSVLIWQWLWDRETFKSTYKSWIILLAGFLVALGPMLAYAITNFSNFSGRANVVVLWTPVAWEHQLSAYNTTSPVIVLWQQIWRTFLTLHLTGDNSPHFLFPRPMVDPLTALLFTLGLGYVFVRIKNVKYFSLLAWVMLTFIFGGVLTADPPYWPHLNMALPAIVLIAAVGAEHLADKIKMISEDVSYRVYGWVMLGIIIVMGILNWSIYYDYTKNNAGNRIRIARYVESLPSTYHVYLFSDNFTWNEYAFRFFSKGMPGQDLTNETLISDPPVLESPTVFILFRHPELVPILQDLYPGGILENHYDFNNLVSFISYRVVESTADAPPEAIVSSPLTSTGWLILFGLIVFWVGYVAYLHYSSLENLW